MAAAKNNARRTHGMSNTATFSIWMAIIARCENPKHISYKYYGAKGIKICDRWRESFECFFLDMGERPEGKSIDRINVNGDYEPGNCRWATIEEQNNNKSNAIKITYQGKTMTISDWAKECGIRRNVLYHRLVEGKMSIDDAFRIPVSRSNSGRPKKAVKT